LRRNSLIPPRLWGKQPTPRQRPEVRAPQTLIVLLDGTMSSLKRGHETNIGLIYRLLLEMPATARQTVYYEPGIRWRGLRRAPEVMAGVGINRQIKRAYLFLARNYQPGDRIVLMGFSRGAYAVRSLTGLIDKMGLLRPAQISVDTLERVYTHYREDPGSQAARALRLSLCHEQVPVQFLGAFDTVRAIGIRWPILWRYTGTPHAYHSHGLGPATQIARHALAMDETRDAYAPVLWETTGDQAAAGRVEQMWFRGTHGDIGGQVMGETAVRPLSNIALVWMLEEAENAGLALPLHWRSRYLTDGNAPSIGSTRAFAKLFLLRHRRVIGRDASERIHPSAAAKAADRGLHLPKAPNGLGTSA